MKIVMTAEGESRALDLSTMPIKDAADCERLTTWTWTEWRSALARDSASAVAFAWWLAGRREGVDVGRFSDVDLDLAKLQWSVELSDEEKQAIEGTEDESPEDDAERPTGLAEMATQDG